MPQYGQYAQYVPRSERCPRHPENYALGYCKRCNRPACPRCAVQTEVGILCSECNRINRRETRTSSFTFSGGLGGLCRTCPVTVTVLALNVALYVLTWILDQTQLKNQLPSVLGYIPLYWEQPWRYLTSAFLHSGFIHLLFNMVMLLFIAPVVEHILGTLRFIAVYVFSAVGGCVFILFWSLINSTNIFTPTIGASGAIYGMLGALLVIQRQANVSVSSLVFLIALNLLFSFAASGVSWQGHVGGLALGLISSWAYFRASNRSGRVGGRGRLDSLSIGVTVWIALVLVALVVLFGFMLKNPF